MDANMRPLGLAAPVTECGPLDHGRTRTRRWARCGGRARGTTGVQPAEPGCWRLVVTEATSVPAAFVGHGNPMNALDNNRYTEAWRALGESVGHPAGVLAISA